MPCATNGHEVIKMHILPHNILRLKQQKNQLHLNRTAFSTAHLHNIIFRTILIFTQPSQQSLANKKKLFSSAKNILMVSR